MSLEFKKEKFLFIVKSQIDKRINPLNPAEIKNFMV